MLKITFFVLLFFLYPFSVTSQIVVIDKNSKSPIPFVEVYSMKGDIIDISNLNGSISKSILKSVNEKIILHHMSYENLRITSSNFRVNDTIYLTPKSYLLKEIVINNSKTNYKYLKLNAYYRSYQYNNDILKYYSDGEVDYYTFLSPKRKKLYHSLIQHRSFINKQLIQDENKRMENRSAQIFINGVGVPYIDKSFMPNNYFKKKELFIKLTDNNKIYDIESKDMIVGKVIKNNDLVEVYLEINPKKNPKTKRFLGYDYKYIDNLVMVFSNTRHKLINTFLIKSNLSKLIYWKWLRVLKVKHKKKDIKFEKIEFIREVFINYSEKLSSMPKNGLSTYGGFEDNSYYITPFWQNVKSKAFRSLPKSIEQTLKTTLTELENVHKN